MKLFLHAACALALAGTAFPAAANQGDVRRAVVRYHDLDLSTERGLATLKSRVKRAVRRVCRADGVALWERAHERACIRQATAAADGQIARASQDARSKASAYRQLVPHDGKPAA